MTRVIIRHVLTEPGCYKTTAALPAVKQGGMSAILDTASIGNYHVCSDKILIPTLIYYLNTHYSVHGRR